MIIKIQVTNTLVKWKIERVNFVAKRTNKQTISATKITSVCSNNIWKEHFWTLYDISAWYWPLNFEKGPRKKSTWTTNTIPVRVTINQFLWTIDLVKRELNIFHKESYTDFEKNENHELFCPKNSVKSCAQINCFVRSSIYSYLQRDLHSWTEENVIIMWNLLLNTAKKKLLTQKKKTG